MHRVLLTLERDFGCMHTANENHRLGVTFSLTCYGVGTVVVVVVVEEYILLCLHLWKFIKSL